MLPAFVQPKHRTGSRPATVPFDISVGGRGGRRPPFPVPHLLVARCVNTQAVFFSPEHVREGALRGAYRCRLKALRYLCGCAVVRFGAGVYRPKGLLSVVCKHRRCRLDQPYANPEEYENQVGNRPSYSLACCIGLYLGARVCRDHSSNSYSTYGTINRLPCKNENCTDVAV